MKIKMKKFFRELFLDDNDLNEKSIVGFCAFVIMVFFAITDIITGILGKPLVVTDFIFNSFLILTLGSFGIASVDKYIVKKHGSSSNEPEQNDQI
jgi:hypothetical protein